MFVVQTSDARRRRRLFALEIQQPPGLNLITVGVISVLFYPPLLRESVVFN